MVDIHISPPAAARREQNREPSGRFGRGPAPETPPLNPRYQRIGPAAAADPNCSADTLRRLSQEPYRWEIHAVIAAHPNCPADVMEMYALDDDEDVRFALYSNPNCDADTREELEESWAVDVRRRGAANPHCRADLLERLASDPDSRVRTAAASNPSLPTAAPRHISPPPAKTG